jgi:hypothetical protein
LTQQAQPRVLFIAGLTHSGTTLLDVLLSRHPNVVGLGEVRLVIGPRSPKLYEEDRRCTCGSLMSGCPFWSVVRTRLVDEKPPDIRARYEILFDTFVSVFGPSAWMADASKSRRALADLVATGAPARVVHLARDVRGWITSRHTTEQLGRRSALYLSMTWYRENRAFERFIREKELRSLPVLYDELCLNPRPQLDRIFAFMDLPPFAEDHAKPNHHISSGNLGVRRAELHEVRYDHRWFRRSNWLLPMLLLPRVRQYNRRLYDRADA